jgi:hypothetical protein
MNRFESRSPSALKRSIIEALRYAQHPLNLCQVVKYVRQIHNFSSDSSLDELIYNTLFDLCSAKMVVKVIGTEANEIRYHLPDQSCGCAINLTFQGELSHEQYNKPSQAGERAWTSLRRTNQYQAEPLKYLHTFNKPLRTSYDEFPCIPVTDSMILESFAARAGIKTSVEGLQRPNTPIGGSMNSQIVWEAGDKARRGFVQTAHTDTHVQKVPTNDDAEILGTKSLPNIHAAEAVSDSMTSSPSESTLKTSGHTASIAPPEPNFKQDKTTKHIKFLKEIADLLDSHEPLQN